MRWRRPSAVTYFSGENGRPVRSGFARSGQKLLQDRSPTQKDAIRPIQHPADQGQSRHEAKPSEPGDVRPKLGESASARDQRAIGALHMKARQRILTREALRQGLWGAGTDISPTGTDRSNPAAIDRNLPAAQGARAVIEDGEIRGRVRHRRFSHHELYDQCTVLDWFYWDHVLSRMRVNVGLRVARKRKG
jgi:hypothetical protein